VKTILEAAYADRQIIVARGLAVPTDAGGVPVAAQWGHWDLIEQATRAGVDARNTPFVCSGAAYGGHLRLLKLLRLHNFAWDWQVVFRSCLTHNEEMAIWALENEAPVYRDDTCSWLQDAASCGCLKVLRWAHEHGRLPAGDIPAIIRTADDERQYDVVSWLRTILIPYSAGTSSGGSFS
jgi:hypothetical protein